VPNRYWNLQSQLADVERLDQYLESVSDQQRPLRDSEYWEGRLLLRSQVNAARFWLLDAWTEKIALEAGKIMLRTMSQVAGLVQPSRDIPTQQVVIGSNGIGDVQSPSRTDADPLPFFLISENHVKHVCVEEYIEAQDGFVRELEPHSGFRRRLLLQDIQRREHFYVFDEWESEKQAYEAYEKRSAVINEITTTGFQALLQERGEQDFALSIS
jgi:quinol monooxygenase YgiN